MGTLFGRDAAGGVVPANPDSEDISHTLVQ